MSLSGLGGDDDGDEETDEGEDLFGGADDGLIDDDLVGGDGPGGMDDDELTYQLDEIDKEIESLKKRVEVVRGDNEQISDSMETVERNVEKLVEMYEIVTHGVNPFVGDQEIGNAFEAATGGGMFDDDPDDEIDDEIVSAAAEDFLEENMPFDDDTDDDFGTDFEDDVEDFGLDDGFDADLEDEFDDDPVDDESDANLGDELETDLGDGSDTDETNDSPTSTVDEDGREIKDDETTADPVVDGEEDTIEDDSEEDDGAESHLEDREEREPGAGRTPTPEQPAFQGETADRANTVSADPGKDRPTLLRTAGDETYLERHPSRYVAEIRTLEWLDFLIEQVGIDGAAETIAYYQAIGWLSEPVETYLKRMLAGFSEDGLPEEPIEPRSALDTRQHKQSLEYIAQIASPEQETPLLEGSDTERST